MELYRQGTCTTEIVLDTTANGLEECLLYARAGAKLVLNDKVIELKNPGLNCRPVHPIYPQLRGTVTMNPQTETKVQVAAIEFDAIEFTETPADIVVEAVREYEASQPELETEDLFSPHSAWSSSANQVVGHEVGR